MMLTIFLFVYLVVANLIAYRIFANDKRYAMEKQHRTPEATLLFWAIVGGWFGAKIAQHRLRHKTYKQPFGRRLNHIGIMYALSLGTLLVATAAILFQVRTGQFAELPIQTSEIQASSQDGGLLSISLRPPTTRPASR